MTDLWDWADVAAVGVYCRSRGWPTTPAWVLEAWPRFYGPVSECREIARGIRYGFSTGPDHQMAAEEIDGVAQMCRDMRGEGWDDDTLEMVAQYCEELGRHLRSGCSGECRSLPSKGQDG